MKPFFRIALPLLSVLLSCELFMTHPVAPGQVNKLTATIYGLDGTGIAAGAVVTVFYTGSADTTPVLTDTTDDQGGYSIDGLPPGIYNLLAVKDSLVLFQDSLMKTSTYTTLRDDTLECPSSLSGIIAVEPSRTMTVQLPGTGRRPVIVDTSGRLTLTGLASGTWRLLIGDSLSGDQPSSMSVRIFGCTSLKIADTIRLGYTVIPPSIGEYHVFYGSLHNHSMLSDGMGNPDEAYLYARNKGGIDFFALSDHCYDLTDAKWNAMRAAADRSNEEYHFVALWGFEWTSYNYCHCTVVATGDYCTVLDPATDAFSELCNWLSTRDGVAFINHPTSMSMGMIFNDFSGIPPDRFVGMELWNKESGFSQYYYNDGLFTGDNLKGFYDEALSRGWKIGASGGDDNHTGTWGTKTDFRLALLAQRLTRDEIISALRSRRFYSTLDKNLAFSFTVDGAEMGSTVNGCRHTFRIKATDGDAERFRELVLYDMRHEAVRTWILDTRTVDLSCDVTTETDCYFYVKIRQYDGGEAISSPVWISCAAGESVQE